MDWIEFLKNIPFKDVPHITWQYSLLYLALHSSFKGVEILFRKAWEWWKKKPPISEIEKYIPFLEILVERLKDPPPDNPFETKRFDDPSWIFYLPNLIKKIFEEHKKECKGLDPQTCILLATSLLNQVWNNTDPEDQNSIKETIQSFQQEIQKTFQEKLEEIRKEFQRWENEFYLPPKLIYENHFREVENARNEELERLGQYVNINLEIKVAQKGGDERENAISVIHKCLEGKRNAIMIGESGSGKTFTFLKVFKELKDKFTRAEILSSSDEIPLFIELYRFDPPHTHVNLQDFLQRYLGIDGTRFLKDKGKYVLFLDGLNESPNLTEAFKAISGASDLRIYLSTQREEESFRGKGFDLFDVLPLGEEEVIEYLSHCPRLGNKAEANDLYQKLGSVLQREIKNPFFLFIISTLYNETGNIPTNLGKLLESFVSFVCERVLGRSSIGMGLESKYKYYKEKILPYMGFSMCKDNKRALGEDALERLFFNKDVNPNARLEDYDTLKEQVSKRYWLMRQSGASLEFTHELLRDYFASAYIKNKRMNIDEVIGLVFTNGKSNSTFASVVQLLCGIESEERVKQLITSILQQDPYLAASCFTLSSATDLALFHNINNAVDIIHPKYLFAERLPRFYLRGLELMEKEKGQPKYADCQRSLALAYLWLSLVKGYGRKPRACNRCLQGGPKGQKF